MCYVYVIVFPIQYCRVLIVVCVSTVAGCLAGNQEKRPSVIQQVLTPIPMLIDLTTPVEMKPQKPCQWVSKNLYLCIFLNRLRGAQENIENRF